MTFFPIFLKMIFSRTEHHIQRIPLPWGFEILNEIWMNNIQLNEIPTADLVKSICTIKIDDKRSKHFIILSSIIFNTLSNEPMKEMIQSHWLWIRKWSNVWASKWTERSVQKEYNNTHIDTYHNRWFSTTAIYTTFLLKSRFFGC